MNRFSTVEILIYEGNVCVCVCARARVCVCVRVRACARVCVCVYEGGGRVILVRHLCVLRVSFLCLELCVFLFDCLLYAPWAQLRMGTQKTSFFFFILWTHP